MRRTDGNKQNFLLRAAWGDDVVFATQKVKKNEQLTCAGAKNDLKLISITCSEEYANKFQKPGQFVQMKLKKDDKAAFIAIASKCDSKANEMEFLVKYVDGSTAGLVCQTNVGDEVLVSEPMGKGFQIPDDADGAEVLLFAAGSGISPIKSLLESDKLPKNSTKTLFYGTRNKEHTAFMSEVSKCSSKVINAYSEDGLGYVQDYFKRMTESGEVKLSNPNRAIAILCGQKEMTEAVIELLVNAGVPRGRCLMNFE